MFNILELEEVDEGLMLLNRCPQCKGEDIGLQKFVNRNGYSYKLVCKKCGYAKNIIQFNEDIPTNQGLLEVTINGNKTNLIVDRYDMDKKTLNLTVHKKDLNIRDMLENIIDDSYPHHRRVCNQLNKIMLKSSSPIIKFNVIGIDRGCVLIKVMTWTDDTIRLMPNYRKELSSILDIPIAYISHFYNKEEHYLIVNCKSYYEQNIGV